MKTKPNRTLKALRQVIGRTQSELASLIGASKDAVVSWENGRNRLSPKFAQRIRMATGAAIESLMDGTGAPLNTLGEPFKKGDFDYWKNEFSQSNERAAVEHHARSSDALGLVLRAAAMPYRGRQDRLPAVWMSFVEWLEHTCEDFKLEKEIRSLLAQRTRKDAMTMTYGDWRKAVKQKLDWSKFYGFRDDPKQPAEKKLRLEVVSHPGWAASGDMRQQPPREREFTLPEKL